MHELSIAQALLDQIEAVARPRKALHIPSATISVGPLSGVEAALLVRAFEVARRTRPMTVDTVLNVLTADIRICCTACGREGPGEPNNLSCRHCGSVSTRLIGGDELLLLRIEMDIPAEAGP